MSACRRARSSNFCRFIYRFSRRARVRSKKQKKRQKLVTAGRKARSANFCRFIFCFSLRSGAHFRRETPQNRGRATFVRTCVLPGVARDAPGHKKDAKTLEVSQKNRGSPLAAVWGAFSARNSPNPRESNMCQNPCPPQGRPRRARPQKGR